MYAVMSRKKNAFAHNDIIHTVKIFAHIIVGHDFRAASEYLFYIRRQLLVFQQSIFDMKKKCNFIICLQVKSDHGIKEIRHIGFYDDQRQTDMIFDQVAGISSQNNRFIA